MSRRASVLIAAILLAALAGPATAGDLSGFLRLPLRPAPSVGANLYDKYAGPRKASRNPPAPPSSAGIVFLRPLAGAAPYVEKPVSRMDQVGIAFVPRVLPIQAGGSVRFTNSDPVFHNVFSLSPARKFDLGRHPKGDARSVTFPNPGVVQVFCDIHAEMVGFVVVVDSPYYGGVAADGRYRVEGIPAGGYDVVVWAEGMPAFESAGQVEIPATGEVTFSPPGRN